MYLEVSNLTIRILLNKVEMRIPMSETDIQRRLKKLNRILAGMPGSPQLVHLDHVDKHDIDFTDDKELDRKV